MYLSQSATAKRDVHSDNPDALIICVRCAFFVYMEEVESQFYGAWKVRSTTGSSRLVLVFILGLDMLFGGRRRLWGPISPRRVRHYATLRLFSICLTTRLVPGLSSTWMKAGMYTGLFLTALNRCRFSPVRRTRYTKSV